MTRKEALARLMRGVMDDVNDYRALQTLLEEQFLAALHYETGKLNDVAERIMTLIETLEFRRAQRVALVTGLLGGNAGMSDTFSLFAEKDRETLESNWRLLEDRVRESKQLNERNCKLMMDQNGIMQRVLHGEEEQIYAPA